MPTSPCNIARTHEYKALLKQAPEASWETLETLLIQHADWTPRAAQQLVQLAQDYGAFMLRNALALAEALDIEDGELGF